MYNAKTYSQIMVFRRSESLTHKTIHLMSTSTQTMSAEVGYLQEKRTANCVGHKQCDFRHVLETLLNT